MNKTLAEWIKEITDWQDKTFTEATPLSAALHLQREVRELIFDLTNADPKSMRYELADCFLLIIGVAHLSGIDLEGATEKKMIINRARKWGKPDSEGVVEHEREGRTLVEIFGADSLPEDFRNLFSGLMKEEDDGKV